MMEQPSSSREWCQWGERAKSSRAALTSPASGYQWQVNLLGDGCAYAIVCELTGYTAMDWLFHCLTQCAAAAHRQNTEKMERQFLLLLLPTVCSRREWFPPLCHMQCASGQICVWTQCLLFGHRQLKWACFAMGGHYVLINREWNYIDSSWILQLHQWVHTMHSKINS